MPACGTSSLRAARGSIKDGPAAGIAPYNWTGPYIGAFVGSTWGDAAVVRRQAGRIDA